jgi:hypothetical protein
MSDLAILASSQDGTTSTSGSQLAVNTNHDLYFPLMKCIESYTKTDYLLSAMRQSLFDKDITFNQLDNDFWFGNYLRSLPTKNDLLIREYGLIYKYESGKESVESQATKKILTVL